MAFTITQATSQDAPELAILINSAYRGESSKQGWTTEADLMNGGRTDAAAIEDILKETGHVILKYEEGRKILGCVEMRKEEQKLYLGMLTVRPMLQGKGIGKVLMKEVEDEAKRQNCVAVYMTVISERKELIAWYARHGYLDTGKRKPFLVNDPRFGQPKKKLEFVVLEKMI